MNKQQKYSLGLIIVVFALMFYAVYVDIQYKHKSFEMYKSATIACEMEDFDRICELCYHGIDGKVFR